MKNFIVLFTLMGLFAFGQEKANMDISQKKEYSILKTKMDLTDVHLNADTIPEFPGGINAFRQKFNQLIDVSSLDPGRGGRMKTTVFFIIEKDGNVSNIATIGDKQYSKEAEKALKQIKSIWKPAILNNEPVRYLFTLPLTMSFE